MHPSNNETKDDTNVDNNSNIQQTNTSLDISNSSSPLCSTLLVIDDTSNSEDETINNNNNHHTNNIPNKPMPTNTIAQSSHIQVPTTLTSSTHDLVNNTVDQQRRRNSSIAKLLGGRPLHNQQYEEIHQQILDSQSAQNANNYDNGIDGGIQRSRSSITRTLLMNNERTNSITKLPSKPPVLSGSSSSKDFEYLIRREDDNEHGSLTLQRNNSAPKVVLNLNSSSNTTGQSKLKRKRPISKPPLSTPNIPPFSLHEPFEIESSPSTTTTTTTNSNSPVNHSQNPSVHFDSSKRPRYSNQQYHIPINNSSSYLHQKKPNTINSSVYNQFNMHQGQTCSSSCNCSHYCSSTPVTHSSSSSSSSSTNDVPIPRKAKSMLIRPEIHERPRQRAYSHLSNESDASSKTTVPLKKRLLDAYNNEHPPTSSL